MSPGLRDGATVLLVRDGDHPERPLEVLMLRRHPATAFGSIWAFPGGAVEVDDALPEGCPIGEAEASQRLGLAEGGGRFWACAARETVEETGLPVTAADLRYLSHWITPEGVATRFDTRFFVARAPEGEHVHDEREHTDSCWIRPADALARSAAGDFELILPTQRNLEAVGRFARVDELLEAVADAGDPRAVDDGGGWRVRLPGDPEAVGA
jgi:8-oxo-dGTP pyrophosphatase MutT (NUDIX family)